MTAMLQDYDVAIDRAVVVKPEQRFRGALIAGVAAVAALVVALGCFFAFPSLHEDVVAGTATANHAEMVAAAADRKAQAEADQRAADTAFLQFLDRLTKQSMQEYFDDPANDRGLPIRVIEVTLVKVSNNKYEGQANMQAGTHHPRQIGIHVTADDQNLMWNTDAGALLPLFY